MSAILNTIVFNKKLESLTKSKAYIEFMRNAAKTKVVAAKQVLLEDFDSNEVIQELTAASKNPGIQDSNIVSKGNLVAALGFYAGTDPAQELKDYIEENIYPKEGTPKVNFTPNKTTYDFKVNVPSKNQINEHFATDAETTLEWTNRSWIDIIENGISNALKKYIFWAEGFPGDTRSRSTTGLQSKGKVSNIATLKPVKFLTNLLNAFKERFNQ